MPEPSEFGFDDPLPYNEPLFGQPERGRDAVRRAEAEILKAIGWKDMVIVVAGMGGTTGTWGASVAARLARDTGALTIAIVTTPFDFEGRRKRRTAWRGIAELHACADTVIVIPTEGLIAEPGLQPMSTWEAFRQADTILRRVILALTGPVFEPPIIDVDFSDVLSVTKGMGWARVAMGRAEGHRRASKAAAQVIQSPLLEGFRMSSARAFLLRIAGDTGLTLDEAGEAMGTIQNAFSGDKPIILHLTTDETLGDAIEITVIATGIDLPAEEFHLETPHAAMGQDSAPPVDELPLDDNPLAHGTSHQRRRPGLWGDVVTFDDERGRLCIDLAPLAYLEVQSWADGLDVLRRTATGWTEESLDPDLPLFGPDRLPAVERWYSDVPILARELVDRFGSLRLALLQVLRRFPQEAADLLRSAPALAWMVALERGRTGRPWDEVGLLLRLPRVEMLHRIGALASPTAVRCLSKVRPESWSYSEARTLWKALHTPQVFEGLRHQAEIRVPLLRVAFEAPELLGCPIFTELAAAHAEQPGRVATAKQLFRDTLALGAQLGIGNCRRLLVHCRNIAHMEELHRRWTDRVNQWLPREVTGPCSGAVLVAMAAMAALETEARPRAEPLAFPPPPLPVTATIIPIQTEADLRDEGRAMGHCAASYLRRILARECFLYRVLEPERATLEVGISSSGELSLAQLKLARNVKPGAETWMAVREWFLRASQGE
jgi:cell division protein FtsZ